MNMMLQVEKNWGCEANQNFLLYVANVLDPRLKLKYVKIFGELYDYDKVQLLTKKVKDNLVSLYEFYLKADEVVDDNRHKQCRTLASGAWRPSIDFEVFCFIVNKGVAT